MSDLDHALQQLSFIHERVVAGTRFQGSAPHAVAGLGVLALALATARNLAAAHFASTGIIFVWTWVAAAVIAGVDRGRGTRTRPSAPRRAGQPNDRGTLRLLLPFGVVGAVIRLVIVRTAPEAIWMLPGLWQLLVALIGFAALRTLPSTIVCPSRWYLACGMMMLLAAARSGVPSPWTMGLPFGIGQFIRNQLSMLTGPYGDKPIDYARILLILGVDGVGGRPCRWPTRWNAIRRSR